MLRPASSFARRLLWWYDKSRRDLPWRVAPGSGKTLDPYHVLVSETMLQQTQVATVIPYYHRFLRRFPTLADLAAAPEQDVLRLWQGLGYYSRARNLQSAARQVVREMGGRLPCDADRLLSLPGIGRYTAGAIASIAFNKRAPILDGNVQRVLCRLDGIASDPRERQTHALLWRRAAEILPRNRVGDFNSALMELGAMLCTPRSPQCLLCPVRAHCEAFATGMQEKIPARRKAAPTPLVRRKTYCIRRGGQWLLEQRPPRGRWASMWQFITRPAEEAAPLSLPVSNQTLAPLGTVRHALTHRRYEFEVFVCDGCDDRAWISETPHRWLPLDRLGELPLPRPHLRIARLLEEWSAHPVANPPGVS